jgi:predicted alpha/beta hydrolase
VIKPHLIETVTDDGWTLRGDLLPVEQPKAAAVLGHAMMTDRRTMDRPRGGGLASTLQGMGIATINFDARGHGDSEPTALQGGRWSYDDVVRRDVPAMVAEARRRFPGLTLTLVGHSLVGHAALIHAGLEPRAAPDAIVSLAGNLWRPSLEPRLELKLIKGAMLAAWAAVTRIMGSFDAQRFKVGTAAEPWPYVEQFLMMYLRDRLASPDGQVDYTAALGRSRLPVLAISSEGDRLLANPGAVGRFLAVMERAEVEHRVLRGAAAPDHMGLVTRRASRPLWQEIGQWILERRAVA